MVRKTDQFHRDTRDIELELNNVDVSSDTRGTWWSAHRLSAWPTRVQAPEGPLRTAQIDPRSPFQQRTNWERHYAAPLISGPFSPSSKVWNTSRSTRYKSPRGNQQDGVADMQALKPTTAALDPRCPASTCRCGSFPGVRVTNCEQPRYQGPRNAILRRPECLPELINSCSFSSKFIVK